MKVGYARVSSKSEEQLLSLSMQELQLQKAGCKLVISESVSAYKGERRGWQELRLLVATRQVTEVMVVDQSRLARDRSDQEFLDECALMNVVVTTTRGEVIENQSVSGLITTSIVSLMNQVDSRIKSVKIKEGVRRRREAGFYGSGKAPFGYAVINGQLAPHPEHWEAARVMWDQLSAGGMNVAAWIKDTGMPWTPRGVRQWIANPILRGIARGKHGAVKPLITVQEWDAAQKLLAVRSVMRGRTAHVTHLFTGLVRCERCEKSLHNVMDRAIPRLKCKSRHCDWYGRGIRVSQVREQVISVLAGKHDEMAQLAGKPAGEETPEMSRLRSDIADLERVKHLPGIKKLIDEQKAQLAAMREQPTGPKLDLLSELFQDPQTLALATDAELRTVIIEFVDSIIWLGGLESLRITLR